MCILNSFTEVDILYFGCMELKILFDFHKKVKTPSCYFEKKILIPRYLLHCKKCLPRCILHRPCYTVNFSSPLTYRPGPPLLKCGRADGAVAGKDSSMTSLGSLALIPILGISVKGLIK